MTVLFFAFDFQVRDGGFQDRVPVDESFATINQAIFVQANKDFLHRAGQILVHGEAFTAPVHRGAQATQLAGDIAAGFGFPFPDLVDKAVAAQIVATDALALKLTLDQHLGGDAGVVGTHLP